MRKRKYVSLSEEDDGNAHHLFHYHHNNNNNNGHNNSSSNNRDDNHHHHGEEEDAGGSSNKRHRKEESADPSNEGSSAPAVDFPIPQCHNIVSTSQIVSSQPSIDLQRLADLFPFTTYDRQRFAAITLRLANPHCTCLLFGSGKLVITGSTSFGACIVASHEITRILRKSSPRDLFEVASCQIQNLVAHVSLEPGTTIDLNRLYERFNEQSTYQRSIFPGGCAHMCVSFGILIIRMIRVHHLDTCLIPFFGHAPQGWSCALRGRP